MRLAHVDEREIVPALEATPQLRRGDLPGLGGLARLLDRRQPAEGLVVDQTGDGRALAAQRARRILAQLQLAEAHLERIEQQQPADQALADAEQQLEGLDALDHADHARQHSQDPALRARRHQPGRRRIRIEAAIAGPDPRVEHAGLTLEAEDAAVDVGLAQQHAGVVHQVAGRKVVGPVHHHVVRRQDVECVLAGQAGLVRVHPHPGVEVGEPRLRRLELRLPDAGGAVQHLALQVALVHHVGVDDAEASDAGGREVERERRPEPAGADQQHARGLEPALTLEPDLGQDQMPPVAHQVVLAHRRQPVLPCGPRGRWRAGRAPRRLGRAAGDAGHDGQGVA